MKQGLYTYRMTPTLLPKLQFRKEGGCHRGISGIIIIIMRLIVTRQPHHNHDEEKMIVINGVYGEGGGQILRSALTLAAILEQPIRIINIRAGRKNPGLAAQHLTAVQAAAMICKAKLSGNDIGSSQLTFEPQSSPCPGEYLFDVAEARQGGSAGSASLVLPNHPATAGLSFRPQSGYGQGWNSCLLEPLLSLFQRYLPAYVSPLGNSGLGPSPGLGMVSGWRRKDQTGNPGPGLFQA